MRSRTGLLVVRVWIEGDPDEGRFRARITHTIDLVADAEVVTAVATADDVCFAVREWLETYLAG